MKRIVFLALAFARAAAPQAAGNLGIFEGAGGRQARAQRQRGLRFRKQRISHHRRRRQYVGGTRRLLLCVAEGDW